MALKGIKVIEMAGLAPVPFCGMVLSDFGARVIRIDRANAQMLDVLGRGKQSISVNLKKKEGQEIIQRLCQTADVLVEPYRPGVMEKLGLGPDKLMEANPKLIYARLTGYGQSGEMSQRAGHDINYIATSGVLSKLGRKHERPYPPINFLADFAGGGLICAMGIVMALYERSVSGKGQVIDANMLEGSAYTATWIDAFKEFFPKKRGENILDGGAAYYDTYKTKDGGYMAVGALEPQFYKLLIQGLGLQDTDISQLDDQNEQRELFSKIFATKTRDEWTAVFKDVDACVTPILSAEEAAEHPHNKCKGTFQRGSHPKLMAGPAPRFSRTPAVKHPNDLPIVGGHTIEVLTECGYSESELTDLKNSGAIFSQSKL